MTSNNTQEADARGKWEPIETAPQDGTHVIIANERGVVGEAFFEEHDGQWYWSGSHWTDAHDGSAGFPTDWMPMPPKPAREKS